MNGYTGIVDDTWREVMTERTCELAFVVAQLVDELVLQPQLHLGLPLVGPCIPSWSPPPLSCRLSHQLCLLPGLLQPVHYLCSLHRTSPMHKASLPRYSSPALSVSSHMPVLPQQSRCACCSICMSCCGLKCCWPLQPSQTVHTVDVRAFTEAEELVREVLTCTDFDGAPAAARRVSAR